MMGIFARLGHVIFLLGLLLTALIILTGLVFIALELWTEARVLQIGIIFGVSMLVALIPLLFGTACCYVLGGFSPPQSE